jgi:phytoene synthase
LTNFWQDLSVDLRKDRIYVPLEDMQRFRVSEWSLFSGDRSSRLGALVRFEAYRTRELFRDGWPLVVNAGYPGSVYFACVWLGGRTVLRMVREAGEKLLQERPTLKTHSFLRVLAEAGFERLLGLSR